MKRNLILLVITLVLAAVVMVVRWDDLFGQHAGPTPATTVEKAALPRVDMTAVQGIEIRDTNGSITLRRSGDGWMVVEAQEYRANAERMQQLLEALTDLEKSELRSSNKDKQHLFETDEAKGRGVKLFGAAEAVLLDLVIGKQDSAGRAAKDAGTYVRERSKPHTFAHGRRLQHLLYTSPALWTDTRLMPAVDQKDLQKLVDEATELVLDFDDVDMGSMPAQPVPGTEPVARTGGRMRVVLVADMVDTPIVSPDAAAGPEPAVKPPTAAAQQRRWSVMEPEQSKALDLYEAQVDGMVRQLLASRFESVAGKDASNEAFGLSKPVAEFTMVCKDGARHALRIGAVVPAKDGQAVSPGAQSRYATVEGAAWVFVVPEYVVTMLQKRPLEMQQPAPPPEMQVPGNQGGNAPPIAIPPEEDKPPTRDG